MVYSPELTERLKNLSLKPEIDEIEIRGASIWAVEVCPLPVTMNSKFL